MQKVEVKPPGKVLPQADSAKSSIAEGAQTCSIATLPAQIPLFRMQQTLGNRNLQRLLRAHVIQAKLTVNHPGDVYEQEADRVADTVMRALDNHGADPIVASSAGGLHIQRMCSECEQETKLRRKCSACEEEEKLQTKPLPEVQRQAHGYDHVDVDTAVESTINATRGGGRALDGQVRRQMESAFGADFSRVRVHTDSNADVLSRAVHATAFTTGRDIFFRAGAYSPESPSGKHLLAHELTHSLQQGSSLLKQSSETVSGDRGTSAPVIYRRAAPYIKKVTVHLAPPQTADLEWEGTPPSSATGTDHFTVSTGKGYSDPGDPAGTCTRTCCTDPMTQCAPPWNQPGRVGACCTYYGDSFWTGTPETQHNGWNWWTPVQPYYSSRGIALHQHTDVTGQPIGHGCVRMADENAKRIFDFSNGRRTNVTMDGRAAPVACDATRRCTPPAGSQGAMAESVSDERLATLEPVPRLEGEMT